MNKQEYADYEARFAQGMEGIEHFSSGSWIRDCVECPSGWVVYKNGVCYDAEPYFSWSACEVCGSTLGGNREDCHGIYDGGLIHIRACSDCVYYAEYGRLDDQTMIEVEES